MNRNENGEVNIQLIVIILISFVAVGFAVAFIWAFGERDNYMNNTESIVAEAVESARADQTKIEEARFVEERKLPNFEFEAPSDFGSVKFKYPRTWASYNSEKSTNNFAVYFYPKMVPSTSNRESIFALRFSVDNKSYETTLKNFESLASKGEVTVTPINVGVGNKFSGMRVDGAIEKDIKGAIAIFKVAGNKTLTLRTDRQDFIGDFNNTILTTLEFEP